MAADMRKCVNRAWKEHGVRMPRERAIIDNLKHSEEWFTQSFKNLTHIFGGAHALVEVDFKEFMEILSLVRDQKQMDELMRVCTGRNDSS